MHRESTLSGTEISRRQVLQATGGTVALAAFGSTAALASEHGCEGVDPVEPPADFPEVDLRDGEPAESNVPEDADEVVVYVYGYNTFEDEGREEAATLESALNDEAYDAPVVVAQWRSEPVEGELSLIEEGENFENAEENATEDGALLADWLADRYSDATVRLVGFSLGSRVVLTGLTALDEGAVDVDSVSLLGPAIAAGNVCTDSGEFDLEGAGSVFNYHSENDELICDTFDQYLSLLAEDRDPPGLGCTGSECDGTAYDHFFDRDVTDQVAEHCAYMYPDIGVVPDMVADFEKEISPDEPEMEADVTVSMGNVGADAWEVTAVDGPDDLVEVGPENPTFTLESGTRYKFENGGWDAHPLAFRDSEGEPLLSQAGDGSFEDEADIDWVDKGDAVAFTVTDHLGAALYDYVCTAHSSMTGAIEVEGLPDIRPEAMVQFLDQEFDDDEVAIDSAFLEMGGFVALYDSDDPSEVDPDTYLGSSEYLSAGDHEDITVEIDVDLEDGQALTAVVHQDTTGDETFDFVASAGETDHPYMADDDSPVAATATISVPEPENGDDDDGIVDDDDDDLEDDTDDVDEDEDDADDTDDDDGFGPGMGPISALSAIGGVGYLLARRLRCTENDETA